MNSGIRSVAPAMSLEHTLRRRAVLAPQLLLNLLASVHVVWFYRKSLPPALNLLAYEQGQERTPFQQRMLLMGPLAWAHHSVLMGKIAMAASQMPSWFGSAPVTPEGVLEAVIDLLSVVVTGEIARRIYQAASPTGWLTPFVYPLTLVMITFTYVVQTNHALRFVYDLPAMALFAGCLFLIYFRRHALLFTCLFLIATINRETTLLLLPIYALTQCLPHGKAARQLYLIASSRTTSRPARTGTGIDWQQLWAARTLAVVLPLAACWLAWHIWVVRHFAVNLSAAGPRVWLNIETMLVPMAWPQLWSAAAFLWPLTLIHRRLIVDLTLRCWVWLPGAWLLFMLIYGLLVETRIFGELIPYLACTTALIAEQTLSIQSGGWPRKPSRVA